MLVTRPDWYLKFSPAGPQVVQVQSTTTPNKMYAQNITRNSTTSVGSAIITSTPIKHSTTATQQSANTQPSSEPNGTDNISHNGKQRGSFWVYVRTDSQGDKGVGAGGTSLFLLKLAPPHKNRLPWIGPLPFLTLGKLFTPPHLQEKLTPPPPGTETTRTFRIFELVHHLWFLSFFRPQYSHHWVLQP